MQVASREPPMRMALLDSGISRRGFVVPSMILLAWLNLFLAPLEEEELRAVFSQ